MHFVTVVRKISFLKAETSQQTLGLGGWFSTLTNCVEKERETEREGGIGDGGWEVEHTQIYCSYGNITVRIVLGI